MYLDDELFWKFNFELNDVWDWVVYGFEWDDEGKPNGLAIDGDVGLTFWLLIPHNSRLNGPDGGFWVWSAEACILAICDSRLRLCSASSRLNCMKDFSSFFSNSNRASWHLAWVSATIPEKYLEQNGVIQ